MNRVVLPSQFSLLGQTIRVVYDENLVRDSDHVGEARYRTNEIRLQPDTPGAGRPQDAIEHAFYHELAHWVLYFAGQYYRDGEHLHQDERLVDLVGGLLHQQALSSVYPENDQT